MACFGAGTRCATADFTSQCEEAPREGEVAMRESDEAWERDQATHERSISRQDFFQEVAALAIFPVKSGFRNRFLWIFSSTFQ